MSSLRESNLTAKKPLAAPGEVYERLLPPPAVTDLIVRVKRAGTLSSWYTIFTVAGGPSHPKRVERH